MPGGEFRNWFDADLLRAAGRLRVAMRSPVNGRFRSDRVSRRTGASLEFAGHRPYAPGDDPRTLDWNAYGRSDRLYTRLFHDEEDAHVCLLIDASGSMRTPLGVLPEKFRQARRMAAVMAHAALAGQHRVSVGFFSNTLHFFSEPMRGRSRFHQVLELLDRAPPTAGATAFGRVIAEVGAASPRHSLMVVSSDFFDPAGPGEPLRALLHRRCDLVLIQISDALDRAQIPLGSLTLADAETGDDVAFDCTPHALAEQAAFAATQSETLRSWALKHGVPLARMDGDASDDVALGQLLKSGILAR